MKLHLLTLTLSLATLAACGKDEAKPETNPPTPAPANETAPLVKEAPPEPKAEPVAPRDPRIVTFFEAGKDCTWDEQGHTKCPTAKEIKDLAFNNQGSSELAASCAGALTDASMAVRGLAATCMQGFNDNARTPHLGAGLDAYEAEKDPGLRRLFAWSFGNGNASKAGVEPRLIALIEKLADDKEGQIEASYFFGTMFPQYLSGNTKPSQEAGDFALKLVKGDEGPLQDKAFEALGLLPDRAAEVCPVLVELTNAETWTKTVPPMAKVGGACLEDLDTIVGLMAEQLNTGKFFASDSMALRQLLRKASLSAAQLSTLKKASKKNLAAHKKTAYGNTAAKLVEEINAYKDPAANEAGAK
jgi:hypothetical protein